MPSSKSLRLTFSPSIALITSTRRFVAELLSSVIDDPDATSRVALTIHELLENTLKYSTDGKAEVDIGVETRNGVQVVELEVRNRTTPERLAELERRIQAVASAADPMGLYVSMMAESARRDGSGLGLIRIRVEGEMQMVCKVDGDSVTIRASTPVS